MFSSLYGLYFNHFKFISILIGYLPKYIIKIEGETKIVYITPIYLKLNYNTI